MEPSANHFERQQTIQKDTTGRAEKGRFSSWAPIITGNPIISRRRELWEEMKTRVCWPTLRSPKEISSQVVEVCGNSTINSISCLRSRDSLSSSYIMQSLIISRALISSVLIYQSIRVVSQNTKISSSHDLAFRTHSLAEVKWVLRKLITHECVHEHNTQ